MQGDVPFVPPETTWDRVKRKFKNTSLNTFDCFGSHQYQHLKSDSEIEVLVHSLQNDQNKILNMDKYFHRPAPIGCALRIFC